MVGNKVKRICYDHQMSLASLTSLATVAFHLRNKKLNFEEWKQQLSSKSPTATSWFTLVKLETFLMMYVRSIREGKFKLFVHICVIFFLGCLHWTMSITRDP